jgi:hypothetical protein
VDYLPDENEEKLYRLRAHMLDKPDYLSRALSRQLLSFMLVTPEQIVKFGLALLMLWRIIAGEVSDIAHF